MTLEKQKKLRKIELIFTEDELNPICHCEFDIIILEDGKEIQRKKHRENEDVDLMKEKIAKSKKYSYPEELV